MIDSTAMADPRTLRAAAIFLLFLLFPLAGAGGSRARTAAHRAHKPAPPASPARGAFLTGADLSELPVHEGRGVKYYDGGKAEDLLLIARRNGWRVIRVRLWVSPDARPEDSVSGLEGVTALGRRIKAADLLFLLDIHYSDTWADPGHQTKPAAWKDLPFPDLVQRVHDYSRDVVAHLRESHALPDLVQVGNETRNGLLYGSGTDGAGPQPGGGFWENTAGGRDRAVRLLAAGLAGVRAGASPARPPRTILHVPDGQDTPFLRDYFRDLGTSARAQGIPLDYDIVGLSYYPADPWDKKAGYDGWTLARLSASLDYVAVTLHKPVMVVETSWPQAGQPQSIPGTPPFPFTPAGQVGFYRALIQAVRAVPDGLGVGVVPWNQDSLNWDSVFDSHGNALPAVRALGQP